MPVNKIDDLLEQARLLGGSDLHFTNGLPPIIRIDGSLRPLPDAGCVGGEEIERIAREMGAVASAAVTAGAVQDDMDFCYVDHKSRRYRVNRYYQQGSAAVAVRLLHGSIPTLESLSMPPILTSLAMLPRGLILVTGPTGSGKSTTLAAMLDHINRNRSCHILTLEDPVEYLHTHKRCMVNQREVGRDTGDFAGALRSALREDPDVILVGEMRDLETISAAVTAAETGHLVLSTLHTTGAASTIDRIVDVFPPYQQQQIRIQLAMVLRGVISQQLVPTKGGGRTAALEILTITDAAANLIRESKCHQLGTVLQTGAKQGMQSMDMCLASLYREGKISIEEAMERCIDQSVMRKLADTV